MDRRTRTDMQRAKISRNAGCKMKHLTEDPTRGTRRSRVVYIAVNTILGLALALGVLTFVSSYRKLQQSIRDERTA